MTESEFNELGQKYGFFRFDGKLYAVISTPFYYIDTPEVLLECTDMDGNIVEAYFARKDRYTFTINPKYNTYRLLDIPWKKTVKGTAPEKIVKTEKK